MQLKQLYIHEIEIEMPKSRQTMVVDTMLCAKRSHNEFLQLLLIVSVIRPKRCLKKK